MIDIFQYSNVYVPTAGLHQLYTNPKLQRDCIEYVTAASTPAAASTLTATASTASNTSLLKSPNATLPSTTLNTSSGAGGGSSAPIPSIRRLFFLYSQFARGVRMSEFVQRFGLIESRIDPRRFVAFGVMNGLIRRIHKYPVLARDLHILKPGAVAAASAAAAAAGHPTATPAATGAVGDASNAATAAAPAEKVRTRPQLDKLLDGRHSYDEICVKLGMSYAELDSIIRLDDSAIAISK
jgi:hypothetical protein